MYQRTLKRIIEMVNQSFPILLLTGARQVGKTTLLEACAEEGRNYVSLDDLDIRQMAQNDPGLFIQTYRAPLIIDEIQYAPELLSYIKIVVDREKKKGLFWLTGSQKFHLMQGITESLAGRVAVLDLLGLSQAELNERSSLVQPFIPTNKWLEQARTTDSISPETVYKRIWLGAFPHIHTTDIDDRDIFYRSYVQTYIQRDVKDLLQISNESTFYNFLVAIAARTGQLLKYSEIAKDIGIDNKTVKAWISVLEASGIIYLLRPYYKNVTKRLITKTPKLYFLDTGLCTYLTKWLDPNSLQAGAASGHILETYVFSEILKSYWHNGKEAHLYYYRDTNQKEIDLVIETAETLHPIEIKKTATPSLTASKSFHLLNALDKKVGHGAVICLISKDIPLSADVTAIPVAYL